MVLKNLFLSPKFIQECYLNNYLNLHVCLSISPCFCLSKCLNTSSDSSRCITKCHKKVALYALRVKNMHSQSPSDPWGPLGEEKPSYVHYTIGPGEIELLTSKLTSIPYHLHSVCPKQLCLLAHLGYTHKVGTPYDISKGVKGGIQKLC